jgi:hypothetical protein
LKSLLEQPFDQFLKQWLRVIWIESL